MLYCSGGEQRRRHNRLGLSPIRPRWGLGREELEAGSVSFQAVSALTAYRSQSSSASRHQAGLSVWRGPSAILPHGLEICVELLPGRLGSLQGAAGRALGSPAGHGDPLAGTCERCPANPRDPGRPSARATSGTLQLQPLAAGPAIVPDDAAERLKTGPLNSTAYVKPSRGLHHRPPPNTGRRAPTSIKTGSGPKNFRRRWPSDLGLGDLVEQRTSSNWPARLACASSVARPNVGMLCG